MRAKLQRTYRPQGSPASFRSRGSRGETLMGMATFKREGKIGFNGLPLSIPFLGFRTVRQFCARVAARLGLEPRQTDSESVVLPLHHRAVKPFRPAGATLGESGSPSRRLEPAMGLEPATPCLQNRCSAIELRRRGSPTVKKEMQITAEPRPTWAWEAEIGGSPGTRTPNLLIKSQLLCQLS